MLGTGLGGPEDPPPVVVPGPGCRATVLVCPVRGMTYSRLVMRHAVALELRYT